MEFLQGLSDDQMALLGCAAALAGCGALLTVSYYVGKILRHGDKPQTPPEEPQAIRLPVPVPVNAQSEQRRAA